SPYGLATSIWTENLTRAHRVAAQIEVGITWVSSWFLRDLRTPFGGSKQSGIGREGGVHSLEFYTELRNVCIKLRGDLNMDASTIERHGDALYDAWRERRVLSPLLEREPGITVQ